jgi:phosphatidylethanolamine/phosphatidyl-N-methylethanolamine N-methyltransferase
MPLLNTNRWNRLRYTLWAPIYDSIVKGFDRLRQRSIALLNLQPGERALIVGAGTGADLPFLPSGVRTVATDLTPAMLVRARARERDAVQFALADGHALPFASGAFDAVILHLIVAVLPDPVRCVSEAYRVLKPNGRAVVFDKFLEAQTRPSLLRRAANQVARVFFTELNRDLMGIVEAAGGQFTVAHREPAALRGLFSITLLEKRGD